MKKAGRVMTNPVLSLQGLKNAIFCHKKSIGSLLYLFILTLPFSCYFLGNHYHFSVLNENYTMMITGTLLGIPLPLVLSSRKKSSFLDLLSRRFLYSVLENMAEEYGPGKDSSLEALQKYLKSNRSFQEWGEGVTKNSSVDVTFLVEKEHCNNPIKRHLNDAFDCLCKSRNPKSDAQKLYSQFLFHLREAHKEYTNHVYDEQLAEVKMLQWFGSQVISQKLLSEGEWDSLLKKEPSYQQGLHFPLAYKTSAETTHLILPSKTQPEELSLFLDFCCKFGKKVAYFSYDSPQQLDLTSRGNPLLSLSSLTLEELIDPQLDIIPLETFIQQLADRTKSFFSRDEVESKLQTLGSTKSSPQEYYILNHHTLALLRGRLCPTSWNSLSKIVETESQRIFTTKEEMEASLTQSGLSPQEIKAIVECQPKMLTREQAQHLLEDFLHSHIQEEKEMGVRVYHLAPLLEGFDKAMYASDFISLFLAKSQEQIKDLNVDELRPILEKRLTDELPHEKRKYYVFNDKMLQTLEKNADLSKIREKLTTGRIYTKEEIQQMLTKKEQKHLSTILRSSEVYRFQKETILSKESVENFLLIALHLLEEHLTTKEKASFTLHVADQKLFPLFQQKK